MTMDYIFEFLRQLIIATRKAIEEKRKIAAAIAKRDAARKEPAPTVEQKHHDLKCWPEPFNEIIAGRKRHEVRKADRDYKTGDTVTLHEYTPGGVLHEHTAIRGEYSGRTVGFVIGHVTQAGQWGLPADACVFSLLTELRIDGTQNEDASNTGEVGQPSTQDKSQPS